MILDRFFAFRSEAVPLAPVEYGPWLVLLSVLIAVLGGVAAMQLIGVARRADEFGRPLATGAYVTAVLSFGVSVWSMHFIGMLAVDLCQPVRFDEAVTAFSVLPSLLASAVGLRLYLRPKASPMQVVHAGVWLGAGIGLMHYTGMAAMEMASSLRYDPAWFVASLVVAISLAIGGLAARGTLRERFRLSPMAASLGSGAILGVAVSGMHYTAMQAALFVGPVSAGYVRWSDRQLELAVAVAVVTCVIFGAAWVTVAITAYRTTGNRLREREGLLSDILRNLPGAVVRLEVDPVMRPVLVSPGLEALTGDPADLAPDAPWTVPSRVVDEDRPAFDRAIGLALADGLPEQATVRLRHADGSTRWAEVRVQASRGSGRGRMLDLYLADVSEERELRVREIQLLGAIDALIGRAVLSPDGRFVEVNERLAGILGYAAEALVDMPHDRLWPDADDAAKRAFWAALRAGESRHGEYERVAADGSRRHLVGWYQPLRHADGQVHGVLKLVVDATDRVRMVQHLQRTEAELRAALASRSAFFANVSHEIRTPMNAVVGFAELLRDDLNDARKRAQAQSILDAARALLRILNDLLDAAKLERGEFSLVEAPFRLDRLVGDLLSQFGVMASAKGLDLTLDAAADLPRTWLGDGDRVRQILTNLLGNAIKFTDAGRVSLRAARSDAGLLLQVADTGIGIAEDRQQAIFDPFVQADAGTARRYGGTGLGMGIVKQLAERMGGHVALSSAPGRGTTVDVMLPLRAAADEADVAEAESIASEAASGSPPLRLLAADDVAQNREVLAALLGRAGHAVEVHDGAAPLLARFESDPGGWDAVLLDLHMPDVDGFAACRALRAVELARGLPRTPVLALSASVHDDDRRAARDAGMDGFLEKPIDLAALHRALGGVVPAALRGSSVDADAAVREAEGRRLWGDDWQPRLRAWVDGLAPRWASHPGWPVDEWHRVAGVAANLALPALAAAARRCERALRCGEPAPVQDADAAWRALRAWLAATVAPIADPSSGADGPPLELDAALVRALAACRSGEIDDRAMRRLRDADAPRAAAVLRALDDFDFETAGRLLDDWRAAPPTEALPR